MPRTREVARSAPPMARWVHASAIAVPRARGVTQPRRRLWPGGVTSAPEGFRSHSPGKLVRWSPRTTPRLGGTMQESNCCSFIMSNSRSSADSAASNEATHMQQDGTGGRKDGKCEPPHLICWHSAMLPARQMSGSRSAAQGHRTCLVMIITQHRLCVKRERSWTTSATSAMMQAGVRWLGRCRAASWRTWAIQAFPNDNQMAQDAEPRRGSPLPCW